MKYKKPNKIYSPKDIIKNVKVIFDGGEKSFSLAKLNWNGREVTGIRWNIGLREWNDQNKIKEIKDCVGVPSSRGYSTWFVLPEELLEKNSEIWKKIDEVNKKNR
jgi:hypothetical protein